MPFVSIRILNAWNRKDNFVHTALDDLESFLWLLIWCIVYTTKDIEGAKAANKGIQIMLDAWSGDLASNRSKLPAAQYEWKDAVFGDLIQEWLAIFGRVNASDEIKTVMAYLPLIPLSDVLWNQVCDWLKSYCIKIYEDILKSGFNNLKRIRNYPDWQAVVAANVQARAQTPAQAMATVLSS